MSDSYTKLFRGITTSTIVSEPLATRWLWVTMLAQCDASGCVWGSMPGLARLANITLEECEQALACFMSPDPYSRTPDNEGRRIEAIPRGWRLLNHSIYDYMRSKEERLEYQRNWDRENRGNRANSRSRHPATPDNPRQPPTNSDSSDNPRQNPDTPDPTSSNPSSISKSSKSLGQQAARFDEFWSLYPNRKGKADAVKTWKRKNLDAIADKIMADVKARIADDRDWKGGYVPHGSTYINAEGWQDDVGVDSANLSAHDDLMAGVV